MCITMPCEKSQKIVEKNQIRSINTGMVQKSRKLNPFILALALLMPILVFAGGPKAAFPACCITCGNANHINVCRASCSDCGSGTDPAYGLCLQACNNNCMPQISPCL